MWFGAGFSIELRDVDMAKAIKPEIEAFLSSNKPNVWAGKTSRRKAAIVVPLTEDRQANEDGSFTGPAGRKEIYSNLFEALFKHIQAEYPGAVVKGNASFNVYDSYSELSFSPASSRSRAIDHDLVFALEEEYGGDAEAIADELGISVEEVLSILG